MREPWTYHCNGAAQGRLRRFATSFLALGFVACEDVSTTSTGPQFCVPWAIRGCACTKGWHGAQTCSEDGQQWLECVCLSSSARDGGPPDGQMPPRFDGGRPPPSDGGLPPPPDVGGSDGGTPGPASCTTQQDCEQPGSCPPDAQMGCRCTPTPMGDRCVPQCSTAADCPSVPNVAMTCSPQGLCVPSS